MKCKPIVNMNFFPKSYFHLQQFLMPFNIFHSSFYSNKKKQAHFELHFTRCYFAVLFITHKCFGSFPVRRERES